MGKRQDLYCYSLYNAHGDVVNLTDATGTSVKSYDYDAFGVEKNPDANDANPWRYCGEYFDTETKTIYLRARYYDPVAGLNVIYIYIYIDNWKRFG